MNLQIWRDGPLGRSRDMLASNMEGLPTRAAKAAVQISPKGADFRVAFSPFSYSHVLKNHWESSSQQHTVNLQNRHFRSRAQESNDSTFKLTTTSGNQQKVKTGKEDFLPGQCILRKLVVLAGFMHKNVEVRLNFYCSRKKPLWKR